MDLTKLEKILAKEPGYRLKQAKQAVFAELLEDWMKVKTLPLELREKLKKECPLKIDAEMSVSKDRKTVKAVVSLGDGLKIETVLMRHKGRRNTVCVSSQVGCALGCLFCATGMMGFKRNLNASEITEQVLLFARYLGRKKARVSNVVFMGMGEPFLNYKSVLESIRTLNDKNGFNLGARHFSISTAGIVAGIEKLAGEKLEVNLAVSLHAPNNRLRSQIMPASKDYPLSKILKAADNYISKTKRKVMFEYIMIEGVNDSDRHASELAGIMKKPLYFVNLIPYNPTGRFRPSSPARIRKFKQILEESGVSVVQRYGFGQDIGAACGQLAGK